MRILLTAALVAAATFAQADDGILNPNEGGIELLADALKARPERAGFLCWVVYETQKGGAAAHKQAFEALHHCAETGNAPSMILLSHAYENGLGTDKNPEQATHWVRRAAELGYSLGQYHYGMALMRGHGVAADQAEARLWLQKAADGGSESAAEELRRLNM